MRVFLDACVDPRVAALLEGHQVTTAFEMAWHTLSDAVLVQRVQDRFEAIITIDQGFEFQHNLSHLRFGIVIVHVRQNKAEFYAPLAAELLEALSRIKPGQVVHVR